MQMIWAASSFEEPWCGSVCAGGRLGTCRLRWQVGSTNHHSKLCGDVIIDRIRLADVNGVIDSENRHATKVTVCKKKKNKKKYAVLISRMRLDGSA